MSHMVQNFTDLSAFSPHQLRRILEEAKQLKACYQQKGSQDFHQNKVLAMIFEKPSTRTRVSFDLAMRQMGGTTISLTGSEMQLGHSETIADTARVLSRFVDIVTIRTTTHERMLEMAEYASIPVINALTDDTHPCQIMADILTYEEHRGSIKGKVFAWFGDGNNVLHSLIEAAVAFEFSLRIATPEGSKPKSHYLEWAKRQQASIEWTKNAKEAADNADCIVTDSWVSMGQEFRARSTEIFMPYQVNEELMSLAKPDALFMHCLPAHRGKEVVDAVIDGPHSIVWDEAENRLHVQKAILHWCLGGILDT